MEGQLMAGTTSVGTPLIVSQDPSTSKVTWTNMNHNLNVAGRPAVPANPEEPMLDWKSLELFGLVEEYVSAVIKGEKPASSIAAAAAAAAAVTSNSCVSSSAPSSSILSTSSSPITSFPEAMIVDPSSVVTTFSGDATAATVAALPNVRYASCSPEVVYSGVKSTTPTSEVGALQKANNPSTLFVMKNVGPNGGGSSEVEYGTLMSQLGATAANVGPLGTTIAAPLASFGSVASLADLATLFPAGTTLPLGATLIASPISVDGAQTFQNVTFTVRDDGMSIIQPTVIAQPSVQGLAQASGGDFSQFNINDLMNYQLDYIVNNATNGNHNTNHEDLSRDGLSPDGSFESSSLSLSAGDPSPSSDDNHANHGSPVENLTHNDVIILSQTLQQHQHQQHQQPSSNVVSGVTSSSSVSSDGVGFALPTLHPAPTALTMANATMSTIDDQSRLTHLIQPTMSYKQQHQQQHHHQQQQQQQRSRPSPQQPKYTDSSTMTSTGATIVGHGSPMGHHKSFLNQATLASALKVVSQQRSAATQGLVAAAAASAQQSIVGQGVLAHGNVMAHGSSSSPLMGSSSNSSGASGFAPATDATAAVTAIPAGNPKTKAKARRSQTKHVPEESLPFPCDVCGRRFVSMHSVKRHMAIHDLDRPWKCEVCQKCFKQQAHLYSHKFTHNGSKPFECTMCHKSFNVKSNLHRHEKEVCKVPLESRTPTRSK